jgi:hypothetical protein
MQSDKDIPGISCGLVDSNIFEWEVMLMISDECKFYGGKQNYYPASKISLTHETHMLTSGCLLVKVDFSVPGSPFPRSTLTCLPR